MLTSNSQFIKQPLGTLVLVAGLFLLNACYESADSSSVQNQSVTKDSSPETLEQLKHALLELDHQSIENMARLVDLNELLADGSTLLSWAVESQDFTNVDILLNQGANVDSDHPDSNHFTPMILACQYGQDDILMRLLDAEPDLSHSTDQGVRPLALCSGSAPAAVVERMIGLGAEVDATDEYGQTALMYAAANAKAETMSLLLEAGADINHKTSSGFTPLFFAIKSGRFAPAATAVDAGANTEDQSADGTTALQLSLYQHNYEFAYFLVEQGADLAAYDRNGQLPLHKAVLGNEPELVALMLARDAHPNTPSGPTTMTWRYESNFKIEDYEPPSLSPLFMAAQNGAADIMRILAQAEATPKFADENGNNLVMAAASSGSPTALSFALELLPKPTEANNFGQTPLDLVLLQTDKTKQSKMLQILENQGVDVSTTNTNS